MLGTPLLRLILIQLAAASIVFALAYLAAAFWQMSVLVGAALQGSVAALIAWRLESPRWWLAIHLLFPFAVLLALALAFNPHWYLAAFVLLLLVFWRTDQSRVPLYLSNDAALGCLLDMLPPETGKKLLDAGCGDARLLRQLARARPDWQFTGIEHAPLVWLWARLASLGQPNLHVRYGSFWQENFAAYDYVYAFLSPAPMAALWQKAARELHPGASLISNSFAVPGLAATQTLSIDSGRQTQLFRYKSPN